MKITFLGKDYNYQVDSDKEHIFICENSHLQFIIRTYIEVYYLEQILIDFAFDRRHFKDKEEFCSYIQEKLDNNKNIIFQMIVDRYKSEIRYRNLHANKVSLIEE